jgi:hypothetical protein
MGMKQKVELHIEKLFLHGFDQVNRHRVGEAVKCELTRLLAEQEVPFLLSRSGDFGELDGEAFNLPSSSKPEAIGAQVAQSVYTGFTK